MKSIKTEANNNIVVSLEKDDTFTEVKNVLNHVTFTKYESISFETNDVHTSVIHKIRDMFKSYKETSNPYDNSVMTFNK